MTERAVSEVLGYALVFSLVVVMVSIISVTGLSGYQDAQNFERQNNAEKAYDVMHNNIEDIYYKGAPSRATEIDLGETSIRLGDEVTVNISARNTSSGVTRHTNVSSRPIVQELGEENLLVYEAGAVFRTGREGGIVRRQPPMTFGPDQAHIVAANVSQSGRRGIGGGIVRVRARSTAQSLTLSNSTQDDPVDVTVNVTSPRQDLWLEYLDDQPTFDTCETDGDTVTCSTNGDPLDRFYVVRTDLGIFFDR